jgi:GntR family transcriptional regulator / MocR family aminotransferase
MRYPAALTVPIVLRRSAPQPLYEQIAGQLAAAVDGGELPGDAQLPSTRTLAGLLGVSRGVVATAYDQLFTRGYLERRSGSGSYVAGPAGKPAATMPGGAGGDRRPPRGGRSLRCPPPGPARVAASAGGVRAGWVDLRPGGGPSPEAFPLQAWRAAWRRASFRPPPADPPPPLGLPELRRAIAQHLRETRGLALAGHEVVVTGGVPHGLRLILDTLGLAGPRVAIEEPAPPALRRAIGTSEPVALPVDTAGARIDAIGPDCRAVVLTPDAHEPLGHVLSECRRREAAAWATDTGGWLVEIACDAAFRPLACRLPRLSSLAGHRATLAGGFDSLLARGLGLGYLVVPAELARPLARVIADREEQPPHTLQQAVAGLLADGALIRLMHRLGHVYRRNRRLVRGSLGGLVRLGGLGGVRTAVLHLPDRLDAGHTSTVLRDRGVRVSPLTDYYRASSPLSPSGLVIGYGHLAGPALRTGLDALGRRLSDVLGSGYPAGLARTM